MLEKGAEVDLAANNGATPLFDARQFGHVDAARLLLEKGAAVDRATESGATPLYIACKNGHVDVVRLVLDKGAEVNQADKDGETPAASPVGKGASVQRQLLLENSAEVDRADKDGRTPLWIACQQGHAAVRLLLEKGACRSGGYTGQDAAGRSKARVVTQPPRSSRTVRNRHRRDAISPPKARQRSGGHDGRQEEGAPATRRGARAGH